jgi:hypothetical protein
MLCFRDKTFCSSKNHRPDCDRQWTLELEAAAEKWWGGPGAPVAFAPLCDAPNNEANHV